MTMGVGKYLVVP